MVRWRLWIKFTDFPILYDFFRTNCFRITISLGKQFLIFQHYVLSLGLDHSGIRNELRNTTEVVRVNQDEWGNYVFSCSCIPLWMHYANTIMHSTWSKRQDAANANSHVFPWECLIASPPDKIIIKEFMRCNCACRSWIASQQLLYVHSLSHKLKRY